jgi:hypothetical protein
MGNKPLYSPEEINDALFSSEPLANEKMWDFICGEIYDFSLFDLRFNDLREKQQSNENFITLVRKATTFVHAIYADVNRTPENWMRAMNCVRLLTRLVPVAFNKPEEKFYETALLQKLMTHEMPTSVYPTEPTTNEKDVSEGEKERKGELGNEDTESSQKKSQEKKHKLAVELDKPCIYLLLDVLIRMLFLPGFTIVSVDKKSHSEGTFILIYTSFIICLGVTPAVLDSVTFTSTFTMDSHKCDILLCLIACVSSPLFDQSHQSNNDRLGVYVPTSNQYIDYLVRKNPQEAESDFSQVCCSCFYQFHFSFSSIYWFISCRLAYPMILLAGVFLIIT